MPNTFVFPGGILDERDQSFPRGLSNFEMVDSQPIMMEGHDDDYVFRIAALRELFEETGILLAFNGSNQTSQLITEKDDPGLSDWRKKVGNFKLDWLDKLD